MARRTPEGNVCPKNVDGLMQSGRPVLNTSTLHQPLLSIAAKTENGGKALLSSDGRKVVQRKPHPVLENFRDRFELNGFAYEAGAQFCKGLTKDEKGWLTKARRLGRAAPVDPNPGGYEAGRFRFFTPAFYYPRAPFGKRFVPSPPYEDSRGSYTTYLQAGGVNRDYLAERRFQPFPETLLDDFGLHSFIDKVFSTYPGSWFPNEGRDVLIMGLHLIKLMAVGTRPGISSPNRAHIDGDSTSVFLLEKVNVFGGESLVVDRKCKDLHPNEIPIEARVAQFTLTNHLDTYVVSDRNFAHYVYPVTAIENGRGWRTVLLIHFGPIHAPTSDELLSAERANNKRRRGTMLTV